MRLPECCPFKTRYPDNRSQGSSVSEPDTTSPRTRIRACWVQPVPASIAGRPSRLVNIGSRQIQNNVASADSYRLKCRIMDFDCPVCHKTNCTVPKILPPRIVDRRV